jgi:hypothetical protein
MSIDKLHRLVGSLSAAVDGNHSLSTEVLAHKLSKCSEQFPQDKTIGSLNRLMNDMISNGKQFIRRADFKNLGDKHFTVNTRFADLFQGELGIQDEPEKPATFQHQTPQIPAYQAPDQVLANVLASAFDHTIAVKPYSQPMADKALKSVGQTLEAWNLRPAKLNVGSGNEKFLVIQADYETPKGLTNLLVPVEVFSDQTVSHPEVFLGNSGAQELNHATLKAYLTQQAGARSKIVASDLLTALTSAASGKREISDAELALTRLNASREGKSAFSTNQVLGLKVETEARPDVQVHKSGEFSSFEDRFTSPAGKAAWTFGQGLLNTASGHLVRQLRAFGYARPQVVVSGSDEQTLYYGVSLDSGRVAFTVPVKVANGKIQPATVLLCNGSLGTFDQLGINQLIVQNQSDPKVAAVASTMASLKPSEILGNLRQAMVDEDYVRAEDALNVLANSGDNKAFSSAFQIYMSGLRGEKPVESACKHVAKVATKKAVSGHPICTQTNLPVHKVYQDKDGNCRPLYRQGMDQSYDGASFLNAKVFGG